MPEITSPGGLPVPQEGPVSPEETRLLTEEGGPRRARAIELDERQFQRLSWALDALKAAIFKAWWRDELIYGGCWFSAPATWPTPEGLVAKVRRFIGAPQWSYLGNGLWRVSGEFEVRGSTLLPQTPVVASGGPWLYYPTEDWPGESDDSLAPIHKRTYQYAPITGAPEPFVVGVGVVDNDGFGANVGSVTEVFIPLFGTSGVPTIDQYTWEPVNPPGEGEPGPVLEGPEYDPETNLGGDPSGGEWDGPNLFVRMSSYPYGWAGGVLTLYAGNNPETGAGQVTIITFLPGTFVYPPVSVYYGPLT